MQENQVPQEQIYDKFASNDVVLQNQNFMQLRLDTRPLMKDIDAFLSSKKVYLQRDEKTGGFYEVEQVVGKPFANEEGINAILNAINLEVNSHSLQGNYTEERYLTLISYLRKELTRSTVVNCHHWQIESHKISYIVDCIMNFLSLALSRTIDNKERDSYMNLRSLESVHTMPKNGNPIKDFVGGMRGG